MASSSGTTSVPPLRCDIAQSQNVLECMVTDITEEFIRGHLKNDEDLDRVTEVAMKLDSDVHDVSSLGEHLPSLTVLNLSGSYIREARSLGTRLSMLVVLNLSRSSLSDLSGMSSLLPNLQELYIAFNCLTTMDGIEWMDSLQIVDLEGNSISSLNDLSALATCSSIWNISLAGNDVVRKATLGDILKLVPSLEVLDDVTRVDCLSQEDLISFTIHELYRGRQLSGRSSEAFTGKGSTAVGRKVTAEEMLKICPDLEDFTNPLEIEGSEVGDGGSSSEPDEVSLVLEEAKRRVAGHRNIMDTLSGFYSARPPYTGSTVASGGDRHTRPGTREATLSRAMTARGCPGVPYPGTPASVLTTGGEIFSGSPLKAIRYRKRQEKMGEEEDKQERRRLSVDEAGLDIRQLIAKYRIDYDPSSESPSHYRRRRGSSGSSS